MTYQFASEYPFNWAINGCFIVQNIITNINKTIQIFNYPIPVGLSRDLLRIPGVEEANIRASLLKGELRNKLVYGEIRILCSDINLLQFNMDQRDFLQAGGVVDGLCITPTEACGFSGGGGGINFVFKQNISPLGLRNGSNRVFTTPDKFIDGTFDGHLLRAILFHNGRLLVKDIDYTLSKSNPLLNYDTITFISFIPNTHSQLLVSYAVAI